jgi:hypothetical protein
MCAVSEGHGRRRWLKGGQQQLGGGDHQRACPYQRARADQPAPIHGFDR